jgi:hypothetical protein
MVVKSVKFSNRCIFLPNDVKKYKIKFSTVVLRPNLLWAQAQLNVHQGRIGHTYRPTGQLFLLPYGRPAGLLLPLSNPFLFLVPKHLASKHLDINFSISKENE